MIGKKFKLINTYHKHLLYDSFSRTEINHEVELGKIIFLNYIIKLYNFILIYKQV